MERKCKQCKKELKPKEGKESVRKNRRFCNQKCKMSYWEDRNPRVDRIQNRGPKSRIN